MKIKRVDIVGFKSFVDKVSLDFQEGVTAILGPNGCGKSNIVDAIRWAMGEQNAKNLRGRSMEDIIFGGSERRKPLGMAEVSIVFANEDGLSPPAFRDYPEIMITRRLHRSGESEYLLNKTSCRLLDISELFMDTGVGARAYSIIEQGKIGMILNAKPEDRRFLIEEAAGVTKFKSRKKSALRKIEGTRQNLLRLGDIIAEVRRQLGSLKRQAQRAERFRAYREELRGIETRFAREKYRELQSAAAEASHQENARQQLLAAVAAQLAEGEAVLEELRLQQSLREKEVTQGQEKIFHLSSELQKVEGNLELAARELEHLARQRERLAAEREEVAQRQIALEKEESGLRESQSGFGADLEAESRHLAEGEVCLEEFAGREQELDNHLESSRRSLYELLTELSRLGSRHEELLRRDQALAERSSRSRSEAVAGREQLTLAQERIAALEGDLEGFRQRQAVLRQEREALQETLLRVRREVEENENRLLARREEFNRQRSRLESLQQLETTLDGYGRGVRALLENPDFHRRFTGVVADALDVPARYEVAVEAVLGDRLQTLLAGNVTDIRQSLEFLRVAEGRCSFLLPKAGPSAPEPIPVSGQRLAELIQVESTHAAAIRGLFAGVFLVQSLEPFYAEPPPAGTVMVTEAGEILSGTGEIAGGGRQGLDQGLLHRKREMKELAGHVERLSGEVVALQEIRLELREEIAATEELLREAEAALHRKELKIIDSEKDRQRLRQEEDRLLDKLEVLNLEDDQLHGEKEELHRQLAEVAQGQLEREQRKGDLEGTVARLQEEIQVLRRETGVVRERVVALKVAVASIREREEASRKNLERLGHLRKDLQNRLLSAKSREAEGEEEQARLLRQRERLQAELEVLFRRREEEKSRLDRHRDVFEAVGGQVEAQEEALKVLRTRVSQAREELTTLQLRGRELVLEIDHLNQSVGERYRIDLAQEVAEEADFDPSGAENRLRDLRRLIDDIGEVNLTAIDEYRELEERYQFLSTQQEDLRQSLEGLQAAIGKINRTTRKRFSETFDRVNSQFREVFPRLFNGGKAELQLTDSEDLLETGIDIIVQPPGKKLQSVNLLSGGEKALTAVALIFSIFMIKPSPFCMLDEVDAPLDDANIGRFNDMIREMSAISQFIIITHSKRSMEVADTLYGITMEEPGISKMVSVRMNDFAA
ncbi:MAG: chromosome segregation protein SMC [Desulfuromonadales bacterium]